MTTENSTTAILKKRLNTFKTEGGRLKRVSNEVLVAFLRAYEQWPGSGAEFFREIGISKQQFAVLMKKAKRVCRDGQVVEDSEFEEIALHATGSALSVGGSPCVAIELTWNEGKVIRFPRVDELVDFLKKVA